MLKLEKFILRSIFGKSSLNNFMHFVASTFAVPRRQPFTNSSVKFFDLLKTLIVSGFSSLKIRKKLNIVSFNVYKFHKTPKYINKNKTDKHTNNK